ncbi:hypothetical protein BC831DRAFT_459647 [Entophlyctis helioformis]|nr:hypothetical protein BC831DRAFT_459647 [Entophlyctis helioformis]
MGSSDDRIRGEQSAALAYLRLQLLAVLSRLPKSQLGPRITNTTIKKAFSNSKELCILNILLPGLRPKKGRYQTPDEADKEVFEQVQANDAVIADAMQLADHEGLVGKERQEFIDAVIDGLPPASPSKPTAHLSAGAGLSHRPSRVASQYVAQPC